jgi:hypothetical protein
MQVERVTNHDVKAIEYVLKERFKANAELHKVTTPPFISVAHQSGHAMNTRRSFPNSDWSSHFYREHGLANWNALGWQGRQWKRVEHVYRVGGGCTKEETRNFSKPEVVCVLNMWSTPKQNYNFSQKFVPIVS